MKPVRRLLMFCALHFRAIATCLLLGSGLALPVRGEVYLYFTTAGGSQVPGIYCSEPLPDHYRLRAKVLGVPGYPDGFHAATSSQNNGRDLDAMPPAGTWTVELYWIDDDTGEISARDTTTFTVYASVVLSSTSFNGAALPVISTTDSLAPYASSYRLRAKVIDGSQYGYHAATSWNNNGLSLDSAPPSGSYAICALYWLKYNTVNGTLIEIGPERDVAITVTNSNVNLNTYSFHAGEPASISTAENMTGQVYRLFATFSDGNGGSWETSTGNNNNNTPLGNLPPPGQYQVSLYWKKFAANGTDVVATGPQRTVTVTITTGSLVVFNVGGHITASQSVDEEGNPRFDPETGNPWMEYSQVVHSITVPVAGRLRLYATGWLQDIGCSFHNSNWAEIMSSQFEFSIDVAPGQYWLNVSAQSEGDYHLIGELTPTVPLPTITSGPAASGSLGDVFTGYRATAVGGGQITYSATGLPAGLEIDSITGIVSGTPTQVGAPTATIRAHNSTGTIAKNVTFTIAKGTPLLTVANQTVANQGLLVVTSGMLPTQATAPATGLPAPTGTVIYTAYRVSTPGQAYNPFTAASLPGLTAFFGPLSVTATYGGDLNYTPAAKAVTFVNLDTQAPAWPASPGVGLQRVLLGPTSFSLQWNTAVDASGVTGLTYEISLDNGATVFASGIAQLNAAVNNRAPGTTYTVRVRARDAFNNVSGWSGGLTVTTPPAGSDPLATSRWFDVNGDGIRDEVFSGGTEAFSYYVAETSSTTITTTTWSDPFSPFVLGYNDGYYYFTFGWLPVPFSTEESVTINTVRPEFLILAESGYSYAVARATSATQYQRVWGPGVLEESVASAIHTVASSFWPEEAFFATPLVMARVGKPVGKISLGGALGTVLGGTTSLGTSRGLGGLITVNYPASGGLVLSAKDILDKALRNGPQIVWEVWDAVNNVKIGNSTLGDTLDLGINGAGQFQVGAKLDDGNTVWFKVTVQPPPPPQIAVDANRNGTIAFDSSDATSQTTPYRFWLNDDIDRHHAEAPLAAGYTELEDDDINPAEVTANGWQPDWMSNTITSRRDLEDFSRLTLNLGGYADAVRSGTRFVALRWVGTTGDPWVKLYPHVEADGGRRYLTDGTTAGVPLTQYSTTRAIGDVRDPAGAGNSTFTIVSPTVNFFILPTELFSNITSSSPIRHLLFEACSAGTGRLEIVILSQSGSNYSIIAEGGGVWMELKSPHQFIERWTCGDEDRAEPTGLARVNAKSGTFEAPTEAERDYVLYVHGYNMTETEKQRWIETTYKRLWHLGFQGRVGGFTWPCSLQGGIFDTMALDQSEHRAWQSGVFLKSHLASLKTAGFRVHVLAHSQGNVVVSEALRTWRAEGNATTLVATYFASQGAIGAQSYDPSVSSRTDFVPAAPNIFSRYWRAGDSPTHPETWPDINPSYFGAIHMQTTAARFTNFYNVDDFALTGNSIGPGSYHPGWMINQSTKPDSGYAVATSGPAPNNKVFVASPLIIQQFPNDRMPVFAFAGQSWSRALGAVPTGGIFSQNGFDLGSIGYGAEHLWHSGQFRSYMGARYQYWRNVLLKIDITPNTP